MKKLLAIIMAAIMLISSAVIASAADSSSAQLKFNSDGKFKMLLLADPQDGYPIEEDYVQFLNEILDKTQPDLVVILGDIVMSAHDGTEESYFKGYDGHLNPIVERDIPFTFVFGNHDDESIGSVTKEQMLAKYQSYDGCLAYDAVPALHGCATHNLEILSSDGTKTAYNLWLMDSGDYATTENGSHYDCVRKDQIKWYEDTSKALEQANGGLVPSMMFQHIIPADVAKQVMVTVPFKLGKLGKDYEDGTSMTYLPNIFGFESGYVGEAPCPSTENEGQWDSLVARGDVKAMFFGHDHVNDFVANVKGVDAVNVAGCTFSSYSNYLYMGADLVTLDESDLNTYTLERIYTNDLALEDGSLLPTLSRSKADYAFSRFLRILLEYILLPFRTIINLF